MTAEQKSLLRQWGWSEATIEHRTWPWPLMMPLALVLEIKGDRHHKMGLWKHGKEITSKINPDDLQSYLDSPEKLQALAMTIQLTYRR